MKMIWTGWRSAKGELTTGLAFQQELRCRGEFSFRQGGIHTPKQIRRKRAGEAGVSVKIEVEIRRMS